MNQLLFLAIILLSSAARAFVAPAPTNRWSAATSAAVTRMSSLEYDQPVFRPPAEWRSLILQVTIGCSWNQCTFCEMYQTKNYRMKSLENVEMELQAIVDSGQAEYVKDVFLADGDAMTLPNKHLVPLLKLIKQYIPRVRRISSYCLPRNVRYKTVEDLIVLNDAGLSLVYVGCESGNDEVLEKVQKGETYDTSLGALTKLKDAGIKRSIMILLGLGGQALSEQHAISSAKLCNAALPDYLSVLTTSFPRGMKRVEEGFGDTGFIPLNAREGLRELEQFLEAIDMPNWNKTIFRSDHASNYLELKGRLGRDQGRLLSEVRTVLEAPEEDDVYNLRPEWARGL